MIKKSVLFILTLLIGLFLFAVDTQAARINGDVIFPKDLSVGEVVTIKIATDTYKDAVVVEKGETPRLVLVENLGSDAVYKAVDYSGIKRDYEISDLKTTINTRTFGHGDYIFNISPPFAQEVTSYNNYSTVFDPRLGGLYWTRSPYYSSEAYITTINNSYCNYKVTYEAFGVRPAFNIMSETILKYNSGKYSVTTVSSERAAAFFKQHGFDTVLSVPQGQTPTGFSVLLGYTGVFYKEFNGMFLFAGTQDYTLPTNIGELNIDLSSEMSQATFDRNSSKYTKSGTLVSANVPSYEAGKFGQGVHIEEATTNLLTANQSDVETDITRFGINAAGTTLTRDTGSYWEGAASLKAECDGSTSGQGWYTAPAINVTASQTYTVSVWVKGSGTLRLWLFELNSASATVGSNYSDVTASSTWTRYSVTKAFGSTGVKAIVCLTTASAQVAIYYTDGFQLEAKAYATSWQIGGTSRAVDALYYNLPSALPSELFMSGVWIPDQKSTLSRTNVLYINHLYFDANNRFSLWYFPNTDKLTLFKAYGGSHAYLYSDSISYSAGNTIAWAAAQLTQAHGDLAAGTHLWYRINNGSVVHLSNTDVNLPTAPTKAYIGCYSSAGYEANGVIDAVKLLDIQAQANQGTTINNAWAESFLTAASAPAADETTLLLCNFDNNLD